MSSVTKINDAVQHQPLRDLLRGLTTFNLTPKGCVSAQNSLIDPALSTAGSYVVKGKFATVAASSSFFTLEDTQVPAYGALTYVLAVNAAGTGVGYAADVLTSAQLSTAEITTAAGAQAEADLTTIDIPDTMCPVGLYTVVAGSVSHVSGSSSFSTVTSAGGSHLFTDIARLQTIDANPA